MREFSNSVQEQRMERKLPFGQYEYVDVEFPAANTEVVIRYNILRPEHPNDVKWLDIQPGSVYSGGSENPATIYRSANPSRKAWASGYVVLMANVAGYSTRLLLFTERN
jgi:hypothetical protein